VQGSPDEGKRKEGVSSLSLKKPGSFHLNRMFPCSPSASPQHWSSKDSDATVASMFKDGVEQKE
jgi:hypothetical protein